MDRIENAQMNSQGTRKLYYENVHQTDFMLQYETANWAEVSRLMLLKNIDMNTVYEAYTSALKWYRTVR
jgi:hypothetical protein